MDSMHIRRTFAGRHSTIVEVRGDLVGPNTEALSRWLEKHGASTQIHLDLSRVDRLDAAASLTLQKTAERLRAAGGGLVTTGLKPQAA